ncbi:MAG: hypothetical protein KC978_21540, partial [Candidatus Omnitrophica bacterium]|nr:hypothetical protein [Candidatus Omnitrophota bacterium]
MKYLMVLILVVLTSPAIAERFKGGQAFEKAVIPQSHDMEYDFTAQAGDDLQGGLTERNAGGVAMFSISEATSLMASSGFERASNTGDIDINFQLDETSGRVTESIKIDFQVEIISEESGLNLTADSDVDYGFDFSIVDVSAVFTLNGSMHVETMGELGAADAVFSLMSEQLVELLSPEAHAQEGNSQTLPISESVTLEPGGYHLEVRADADINGQGPSSSAGTIIDLTFEIVPFGAEEIVWTGQDGHYTNQDNWTPSRVPTGGDDVRFHESDISPVEVSFGSEQLSSQAN